MTAADWPRPRLAPGGVRRRIVHRADTLLLEDSALAPDRALGHGYSDRDQIVLPYHGVFSWQVGRTRRMVDANTILFVRRGQEFHEIHPVAGLGHGSAIVTPGGALAAALRDDGDVTRPMSVAARLTVHRLLFGNVEPLEREEVAIGLLGGIAGSARGRQPSASRAVIARAKEFLHCHPTAPLSLSMVARAVGVGPTYLTQVFSREEGMPLYRYQLMLRLGRALAALPDCEDLTGLALDLGFSSHSHFSAMFRATFGITPSGFRSEMRGTETLVA